MVRVRWVLAVAALLLLALAPGALAAGDQGFKGTIKAPDGAGVSGVKITVSQDGSPVGTATSDAKGAWTVPVDGPGTYDITLDPATLPKTVQLRNVGGETLKAVSVRAGQTRTVIFPLVPIGTPQEEATPAPSAGPTTGTGGGPNAPPSDTGNAPDLGGKSMVAQALQLLVESLKFGSIIAVTAIGLSLVFGTTGLINFAHGEFVTIGAVVAFFLSSGPGSLPLVLATVLAVIVGAGCGAAIEAGLWRPLRRRGTGLIQMFIVSIGVSLLLRHLILIIFGSRRQPYREYTVQNAMDFGPVSITLRDLIVILLSALVLLAVAYMLLRTRIGKATRAVADNVALAESSGINVDRVILTVWVIGGGLAALGGVFFGLVQQAVFWDMGFNLLLLMFAGVILGGLGSAFGAVVGSFVVALVAQMSTLWFPIDLQYAWALLALIVVLLVRPQGILGKAQRAG